MIGRLRAILGTELARSMVLAYFPALFSILSGPLVARALGPALLGAFAAMMLCDDLSTAAMRRGIPEAAVHLARGGVAHPTILTAARRASRRLAPFAILLAIALFIFARGRWPAGFVVGSAILVAWSPLVSIGYPVARNLLMTANRQAPVVLCAISTPFALVVGVLVSWHGIRAEWSIPVMYVAATGLAFGFANSRLSALHSPDSPGRDRDDIGVDSAAARLEQMGTKAWPASILQILAVRMDQMVILAVLGRAALGTYAVALSIGGITDRLANALALRQIRAATIETFGLAFRQATRSAAIALAVGVAVGVFALFVLPGIFGPEYGDARVPALLLAAVAGPMTAYALCLLQICNAHGDTGASSYAAIGSLLVVLAGIRILAQGGLTPTRVALSISVGAAARMAVAIVRSLRLRAPTLDPACADR